MMAPEKLIAQPDDEAVVSQPRSIIFSRIEPGKTVKLSEQKALHAIVYGFQDYVKRHYKSIADYKLINGDSQSVIFSMSKKRFFHLAGLTNTRNVQHVKNLLNSLQDLKHSYDFSNALGRDKYGSVSFIYRWDVDGDRIQFTLPHETRMAMLQEDASATFCLNEINQKFTNSSKYSIFLYPALLSHRSPKAAGEQVIRLTDQQVRDALRVKYQVAAKGERKYEISQPSRLNRQCIEPAIKSINDIQLDYQVLQADYDKTLDGEIIWSFKVNQVVAPEIALFRTEHSEDIADMERKIGALGLREDSRVDVVQSMVCTKSLEYIKYCFNKLKERAAKSKMGSSAAYFWTIFTSNGKDFDNQYEMIMIEKARTQKARQKDEANKVRRQIAQKRLYTLESHAKSILSHCPDLSEIELTQRFKEYCLSNGLARVAAKVYDRFEPEVAEERSKFIMKEFGGHTEEFINNIIKEVTHHNEAD